MKMFARHLASIAVLPFVVAVLVPVWLARTNNISPAVGTTTPRIFAQIGGVLLMAVGLLLFASSLRRFAIHGEGTLAPWDPPRRLVVRGPYRYVRNPMISGVLCVLFGEALFLLSRQHLVWALIFLGMNILVIPLVEEPGLRRRFGDAYVEYCRHVPRLIPRLRPWDAEDRVVNRSI
ncbi:MAG TPA: isoprenylcysteine carboxylmethyltransferase family protein [Gemmatimonadaceae bacterium]|jgi:protein-S-isoprenylcysteine O-methyltransferase Ste14|nr:isoprenylcysteine carboxylmethyltransferase family protein [Gemmatimonadaceae bacterium]